jgi:hypothetical protein
MDTLVQDATQLNESARAFRNKTAVAGVGPALGNFPDWTALSLAIDAFARRLGARLRRVRDTSEEV